MKKKIGYVLLILISVLGSRLIFGKDYHLNSDNLIENNLYLYDISNRQEVTLTMVDDEYIYYVLKSNNASKTQYDVIKYNLINNRIYNQYTFITKNVLKDIKMFKNDGYIYLTAINWNLAYKFDRNLQLVKEFKVNSDSNDSYSIFNDSMMMTNNNIIIYQNNLYDTLPKSCGKAKEILYNNDFYYHFHNYETGFGCLYHIKEKTMDYLDYENVLVINNHLLEYQNNRQSFKYNGNTYYFNDITESDNLKMHANGDYLFTVDMTNYKIRIYNLDTKKIIKEKVLVALSNSNINNILIDDYVYFTLTNNSQTKLYIWDYLKESHSNKDMLSYNEKEYKFKNSELKDEIKNNYHVDVYTYDQAVNYFQDAYILPSYDDILLYSRLSILKDVLDKITKERSITYTRVKIYFAKDIIAVNSKNSLGVITNMKDNSYEIAINITDDNFKNTIFNILNRVN